MIPRQRRRRRAFSLVELLVVIALVALLVGLLLPSLAESRRAAQGAVSLSNLRQLITAQGAYANEHKDSLVNPFDPERTLGPGIDTWAAVYIENTNAAWLFSDERYASLMFSAHWASLMMHWIDPGNLNSMVQFSPADASVIARYRELEPQRRSGAWGENAIGTIGWDGSYWISPTFWTRPELWQGTAAPRLAKSPFAGPSLYRRNRLDHVTSPQAKVAIWERFDSGRTSRPHRGGGGSREKAAPNWNNPEATARTATVDGNVHVARIAPLEQAIARDEQVNAGVSALRPCGEWDVPDQILARWSMEADGLENGGGINRGLYPSYFWATRNGVQGRDLSR